MKKFLVFLLIFPSSLNVEALIATSSEIVVACYSFEVGEQDAYQTIKSLQMDFENSSLGLHNTLKIICS